MVSLKPTKKKTSHGKNEALTYEATGRLGDDIWGARRVVLPLALLHITNGFICTGIRMHSTPEHCLVNGGFQLYFGVEKAMIQLVVPFILVEKDMFQLVAEWFFFQGALYMLGAFRKNPSRAHFNWNGDETQDMGFELSPSPKRLAADWTPGKENGAANGKLFFDGISREIIIP